jgi:hypothetical protein
MSTNVTVGAANLTLFHLNRDAPPVGRAEQRRDLDGLRPAHVVELEHIGVGLAAVDAGVVGEVKQQPGPVLPATYRGPRHGGSDVVRPVQPVMLPLVAAVAFLAHRLEAETFVPREGSDRELLLAATAALGVHEVILDERVFVVGGQKKRPVVTAVPHPRLLTPGLCNHRRPAP